MSGGSWFSPDEKWQLSSSEILKAIIGIHPKFILGCRAGSATRYAVIDIDADSKYHNQHQLQRLRAALNDAGITRTIVYRSSFSEGWHLYIFFDEPINSKDLRAQLVQLLKLNKFDIAKGTLEVFPAPGEGSLGNGLRLPLQPGFAWLNQRDLEIEYYREELSPRKALEWFLTNLSEEANSRRDFLRLKAHVEQFACRLASLDTVAQRPITNIIPIPIHREKTAASGIAVEQVIASFGHVPGGLNCDDWLKGRQYFAQGLTGPSQAAEFKFCLSHYLFYGDPQNDIKPLGYAHEDERQWLMEKLFDAKHNGHSKDFNRNRKDAMAHIARLAHWRPEHLRGADVAIYKPEVPIAWVRHNANQAADAQARIKKAVEKLVAAGQPFSIRDLKAAAKCSEPTLYKYQDLWRTAQEQLRTDRLDSVLGEYNAGVGGGSSKTDPPSPSVDQIMPPGRLAARRIIFEMNMRKEREQKKKHKDLHLQRASLENSWKLDVLGPLPESIKDTETRTLHALIDLYSALLARSPDEESQSWLIGILRDIRTEANSRSGQLRLLPPALLDNSS